MKLFPIVKHNRFNSFEIIFMLAGALAWNQIVYYSGRLIAGAWYHYDMTLSVDNLVPFIPWTVVIYFGCYLYWAISYFICANKVSSDERHRFFYADSLAKTICLIFFILLPTTNIRPEVSSTNIWDFLMNLLYTIDSPDNLFPSIHCLVSWLCWIGIRKRKDIPFVFKFASFVAASAVCISTLTTRQHVIVDVISGIFLAEICYYLAKFKSIRKPFDAVYSFIFKKLKIEND